MKIRHFIPTLILSTIAQVSIFSQLDFLGAQFELLFALTIFIAIRYNWYEGAICGIWCGLFADLFSIGPLGTNVFIYSLSGFIAAISKNFIFTQHVSMKLMILFLISFFSSFLKIILIKGPGIFLTIWTTYKLKLTSIALVNTLFAIIFYIILDKLTHELQR